MMTPHWGCWRSTGSGWNLSIDTRAASVNVAWVCAADSGLRDRKENVWERNEESQSAVNLTITHNTRSQLLQCSNLRGYLPPQSVFLTRIKFCNPVFLFTYCGVRVDPRPARSVIVTSHRENTWVAKDNALQLCHKLDTDRNIRSAAGSEGDDSTHREGCKRVRKKCCYPPRESRGRGTPTWIF